MEECSICLNNLDFELAELECGHAYHFTCIGKYQNAALIKCPLCRRKGTIIDVYDIVMVDNQPVKVGCEMIHINNKGEVVQVKWRCCTFV